MVKWFFCPIILSNKFTEKSVKFNTTGNLTLYNTTVTGYLLDILLYNQE